MITLDKCMPGMKAETESRRAARIEMEQAAQSPDIISLMDEVSQEYGKHLLSV